VAAAVVVAVVVAIELASGTVVVATAADAGTLTARRNPKDHPWVS